MMSVSIMTFDRIVRRGTGLARIAGSRRIAADGPGAVKMPRSPAAAS